MWSILAAKVSAEEYYEENSYYKRAYNNPFHPEDDMIIDNMSDKDGDNLSYGETLINKLSEEKKNAEVKKLMINGRFYDINNTVNINKSY